MVNPIHQPCLIGPVIPLSSRARRPFNVTSSEANRGNDGMVAGGYGEVGNETWGRGGYGGVGFTSQNVFFDDQCIVSLSLSLSISYHML